MAQNTSSKPPRGCYSIYPSACFTCLFWCTERKPEQLSVPAAGPAAVPNAYHYFSQGSCSTKLGQNRTATPQILITEQSLENWSAWLAQDAVSLPSEECFLSLRVPFLHPIHPHLQNIFKMSVHVYKKLSGPWTKPILISGSHFNPTGLLNSLLDTH